MITFTSSLGSVILPNPILGNSEQLNTKTKFAISMSRAVHTSIQTTTHSKLLLTFNELLLTELTSLFTFLATSRGLQITYTDYDGVSWVGTILGDPFEGTHVGENECQELYSVSLEFEAINT